MSNCILECGICGEPVKLSRKRFLELVRTDRLPLCRKNGCHKYAGVSTVQYERERLLAEKNPGTTRTSEGAEVPGDPMLRYGRPDEEDGCETLPLAKGRVRRWCRG